MHQSAAGQQTLDVVHRHIAAEIRCNLLRATALLNRTFEYADARPSDETLELLYAQTLAVLNTAKDLLSEVSVVVTEEEILLEPDGDEPTRPQLVRLRGTT